MIPHLQNRLGNKGVTLLELIAALAVFMLLIPLILSATGGVQKIWAHGDRKVESLQNGRAVLEIFSRELTGAIATSTLQFAQTPDLSALVTKAPHVAQNSPSLFWISPVDSANRVASSPEAATSNPCEVGYYLTRDDTKQTYRLNRLVISPESPFYQAGKTAATWDDVPWLAETDSSVFDPDSANCAVSPVAEDVIAMWIRCFDIGGNPIPWLSSASGLSAASPLQFNSAAPFQMSPKGANFDNGSTFQYLGASTVLANRLPGSVEITIVLLDSRTLSRKPVVPLMPAPTTVEDVPEQIRNFQAELTGAGIPAGTYSVRIPLVNSTP